MVTILQNIAWAMVFSLLGAVVGIMMVLVSAAVLPKFIQRLTPNIDEEKELARGNRAVAEYYSRIVAASIVGISIVIAAAVLGGFLSGLH